MWHIVIKKKEISHLSCYETIKIQAQEDKIIFPEYVASVLLLLH